MEDEGGNATTTTDARRPTSRGDEKKEVDGGVDARFIIASADQLPETNIREHREDK